MHNFYRDIRLHAEGRIWLLLAVLAAGAALLTYL